MYQNLLTLHPSTLEILTVVLLASLLAGNYNDEEKSVF